VRAAATWLRLDEEALARKIDAAMSYPELREEVSAALARFGRAAFALECLRPVTTQATLDRFAQEPPMYERYGEYRVNQGRYSDVIRFKAHVLPAWQAIGAAIG
jgi:hypothetical protein